MILIDVVGRYKFSDETVQVSWRRGEGFTVSFSSFNGIKMRNLSIQEVNDLTKEWEKI